MTILAWLLGAALCTSAHEIYPIRPVSMTLRVEPDRIVADLRTDSIFWIEEVARVHPMPTRDWPAETRAIVESYVNAHFALTAGGAPLIGRLVSARYRQFPWEVNEEGAFIMRLVYPAAAGASLNGTASFHEEYRKRLEGEFAGRPIPFADGYRTVVDIPGRRHLAFTLTQDAPSFTASIDEARRSSLGMALESFSRGMGSALGTAAGFPALLAIALCLGAAPLSRTTVSILIASTAFGFLAGRFFSAPSSSIWVATLGASLAVGRGRLAFPISALAACCLGATWYGGSKPLLPHSALAFPSALFGALTAGAALLLAAWFGVRAEHRRLAELSESRVDELFARRARLTATALAMVGAYGLWQSLPR